MRIPIFGCALAAVLWLLSHGHPNLRGQSPVQAGDHVAIVGNTFADQLRIHGYLEVLLLQRWPMQPVSIRNLGWAGDMLSARDRPTGFATEESTLRAHQTDVIVACFGMGESFQGELGLEAFRHDLRAFIHSHQGKSYNGNSEVRLILVSPIAYEDLGNITPDSQRRNGELAVYSQAMQEVATEASIPFVDLYRPSRYWMDEPVGPNYTTNGIHLNALGYWAISHPLYRELVNEDLGTGQQPWHVWIDMSAEVVRARGLRVFDVNYGGSELSFTATELSGPTLPPPTSHELPPQLQSQRDRLSIANLPPGNYQLTIDGQPVVFADHVAWADGVAVDSSPAHLQSEALRQAVYDKNLQFTYSWKALNQVHIVGERSSSPSGRALPAEVKEFCRLADQLDRNLHDRLQFKTRQWRVQRVAP